MTREGRVPAVGLRPPAEVMRLERLGAAFPTRLSFMRVLIRRLAAEGARVSRPVWEIDPAGYGHAVYSVALGGRTYSLVAVSTPLDPSERSDRVIAEAWDTAYVLYDGVPETAEIARIARDAPRQEAARFAPSDLVLSRANRSARLFDHVVERLAAGRQPDAEVLAETGYLMRTTAVYGNGKYGIADRARIAGRAELAGPFQAEMLTVWLIRRFTLDLVEQIAAGRSGGAAPLSPGVRRLLGIGNSTGLGMAPFLVTHPVLLHRWIAARETAIARVRAVERAGPGEIARFTALLERAQAHCAEWCVCDPRQAARVETLRAELSALADGLPGRLAQTAFPWDRLIAATGDLSEETQELVAALVLEPHGDLVDDLADEMAADHDGWLEPEMTVASLRRILETQYDWALGVNFAEPAQTARFWYVSQEKLEPRLGERAREPGADRELPLDIARQVQALCRALVRRRAEESVARLLLDRPELRAIVRRVQTVARHPYGEVRANLLSADCVPVDLLRAKLAFFGASKFDPKSDRWTRITMFQGAPLADPGPGADDWAFPVAGGGA